MRRLQNVSRSLPDNGARFSAGDKSLLVQLLKKFQVNSRLGITTDVQKGDVNWLEPVTEEDIVI
ncbi:MAG: hypothetical protein ACFFD4_20840 [Candidatus Odinarchaeota archaeon]